MSDDLEEAIALLLRKRAEHETQITRIDSAVAALQGVAPEGAAGQEVANGTGSTAREKAMILLNAEDREWSAAEIVAEWERRGEPQEGVDPRSAVRKALQIGIRKGHVVKSGTGRYKSAKYAIRPTLLSDVAVHRNGNGALQESGQVRT